MLPTLGLPGRSALLIATLFAFVAGCGGSRSAAPGTLAGTWVGEGKQWNDGDRSQDPDDEFEVRVSLVDSGLSGGSVEYPELACGGTLEYAGPNTGAGAQPGDMVFQERLSYGTDNCADGGTVLLRPSGRYLIYAWSIDGYAAEAAARLSRE